VLVELQSWGLPRNLTLVPVRLAYSLAPSLVPFEAGPGSVCVLDACFPPTTTEALVSEVVAAHPGVRVVVVTEALIVETAVALVRRGVKGILAYADAHLQLPSAIQAVASGGLWVPREVLSTFLDGLPGNRGLAAPPAPKLAGLSRRETDVLDALLRNESNKEIAARLDITERTVKFHVSNLLAKFSVQRRADLILLSLQSPPGSE
jgi:DNA-binding NarL/FixJ family response regulator